MQFFKVKNRITGKYYKRGENFTVDKEAAGYFTAEQVAFLRATFDGTEAEPVEITGSRFFFRATFHFANRESGEREQVREFATLEEMETAFRVERRRRKRAERATGGHYSLELTEAGTAAWRADENGETGFRSRCRDDISRNIPLLKGWRA